MLFMITGILKPGSEDRVIAFSGQFSEHLAQRNLSLAGLLRDRDGRRIGYMALLEADSFDQAEQFLHESPFFQEGLYERTYVAEYLIEVGSVAA